MQLPSVKVGREVIFKSEHDEYVNNYLTRLFT